MSRISKLMFLVSHAIAMAGMLCAPAMEVVAQDKDKKDAVKKDDKEKKVGKDKKAKKDAKKDDKDKVAVKDKKEEKKEPFKADQPLQEFKYTDKDKTFWVYSVAFGPGGKTVAAAYKDRTVKIWDLAKKAAVQTLKGPAKDAKGLADYRSIVYSGGNIYVGTGWWDTKKKARQGEIRVWDAKSGKPGKALTGHAQDVEALALSKDGKLLASASEDNTVLIWNLAEGKTTQTIKGHTDFVTGVAFSPDGKELVTTSKDKTVRVWNLADAKEIAAFKVERMVEIKDAKGKVSKQKELGREFTNAVFTPDSKKIITGNLDGVIKVYDIAAKKEDREMKAHEGVWAMTLSPDGTKLATGGWDGTIKLWNVANGKDLRTIKAHADTAKAIGATVTSVAFSPNGQLLASGSIDGVVKIWSIK